MNQILTEYDSEPVRGLPEVLPDGEKILWQGAPRWQALARRALHTRKVAVYFAILGAWNMTTAVYDGYSAGAVVMSALPPAVLGAAVIGILSVLAWLSARTTVYTITNRRIILRYGVALTKAVNLPFTAIKGAALKAYPNGTGDIPIQLSDRGGRIAYFLLWPHVRPWKYTRAEPMIRAIPEATKVAGILSEAFKDAVVRYDAEAVRYSEEELDTPALAAAG